MFYSYLPLIATYILTFVNIGKYIYTSVYTSDMEKAVFIGKVGRYATGRVAIWVPKEEHDKLPTSKRVKVIVEEIKI